MSFGFPRFKAIDGNGNPIRGGKLYTYNVGTSVNRTSYSDYALTVAHANPVVLDSEGEAIIYLSGSYKMNLKTSADAQVPGWPIDNIDQVFKDVSTDTIFLVEHKAAGTHGGKFIWRKGADVASPAGGALALGTDGNYFDITGTNAITSINTLGVGTVVALHFDAALVLTHHATDLVLPGAANITTVAGDELCFIEYATGDWRLIGGNSISLDRLLIGGKRKWQKGADIASAAALAPGADGDYFDVTGSVTITSINTVAVGAVIKLHFDAALTITHHATDLVLPNSRNISTQVGDELEFTEYATGDWRLTGGNAVSLNYLVANRIQVTSAPPATPVLSTIYNKNVIQGWITFNGTGVIAITDSHNVTSITDTAVGRCEITWNADLSNANYAIAGMALHPSTTTGATVSIDQASAAPAAATLFVSIHDTAGALIDSARVSVIIVGS